MNLQVVCNKEVPTSKWIVWKRNIAEKYFYCMEDFSDNTLKVLIETKQKDRVELYINTLKNDQSKVKVKKNPLYIVPTDTYRNMTIFEYICLGFILKKGNMKYNKKKDEFTTCI